MHTPAHTRTQVHPGTMLCSGTNVLMLVDGDAILGQQLRERDVKSS